MNDTETINGDEVTPTERLSRLSDREREVLHEFCEVFNTIERGEPLYETIGHRLFIAKPTVTTYMGRIFIKLGLDILHRSQRRVELVQTYCPLILETGGSPKAGSESEQEGQPGEEPEEDEEEAKGEEVEPEEEEEEPEPVPEEVKRMVEELETAIVPVRVGTLLPTEQEEAPPQTSSRLPWFILGVAVTALVIVGAIAFGVLPLDREQQVVVVTATPSSEEAQAAETEPQEVTREVTVEVASTPAPSEPTTASAAREESTTEPTVIVVTATPAPSSTPRPIEMALPFEDNFNQGPREEWEVLRGRWRMVDGAYGTDEEYEWSYALVGDPDWQDYAVEVDVLARDIGTDDAVAILLRSEGLNNGVRFDTDPLDSRWVLQEGGESTVIAQSEVELPYGWGSQWSTSRLRVGVQGNTYSAYLDGELVSRVQDSTFPSGRVGLGTAYSSDSIRFDNFVVEPLP